MQERQKDGEKKRGRGLKKKLKVSLCAGVQGDLEEGG